MAKPLPALISTSEHRTVILEEEDEGSDTDVSETEAEDKAKDLSPPPSPSQRLVYLADACILICQDPPAKEIHPPILLTASTCDQRAMELGDHIRIESKTETTGGWVSSLSLEQPGWLVADISGWRQQNGEAHRTCGTFEIVTRYKWMSRNVPTGPVQPKRFRISIDKCIRTDPVTGLWGWMVKNMDSNIGM
jgi:hypothetical protein